MPLGPEILLKLVEEQKLVEGLDERELKNPEGAGFDLRLGEIHEIDIQSKAYLGVTTRQTPETKIVAKFEEGNERVFVIAPGKYFLLKTMEKVNVPIDLGAYVYPRSTLFRSGLIFLCTKTDPGYSGELIFGIYNAGPISVPIEMGARIANIQFERVEGGGSLYRGQNQGGRVTSQGKTETQV